ncbi:MAG: coiled-coil domain-containing protein [Planctomycetota bacterium]
MKAKLLLLAAFLLFFAGCAYDKQAYQDQLKKDFDSLRLENTELTRQVEKLQKENDKLNQQKKNLAGIDPQFQYENLYNLQAVKVHKYTNLYDKDDNGDFEKLIVYIQPMDSRGDIVKAAGAVDVELWDLKKEEANAKIGQWQIQPGQLQQLWFAAIVTNYKLTLNLDEPFKKYDQPLIVKVTFTDHLTGKTFQQQKIIEAR